MSNLIKFDPFAQMQALQRQFFGDEWLMPSFKDSQIPTTDVYTEDDKQLIVEAHLPNFEEKDIDISIDKGSLVIRAERHEQEKDKSKKYVVRESSSSFYRQIRLPETTNQEKIDAKMNDGVLKIVVPLKELPVPKKIAITK